jgi:hypothetical protein
VICRAVVVETIRLSAVKATRVTKVAIDVISMNERITIVERWWRDKQWIKKRK